MRAYEVDVTVALAYARGADEVIVFVAPVSVFLITTVEHGGVLVTVLVFVPSDRYLEHQVEADVEACKALAMRLVLGQLPRSCNRGLAKAGTKSSAETYRRMMNDEGG